MPIKPEGALLDRLLEMGSSRVFPADAVEITSHIKNFEDIKEQYNESVSEEQQIRLFFDKAVTARGIVESYPENLKPKNLTHIAFPTDEQALEATGEPADEYYGYVKPGTGVVNLTNTGLQQNFDQVWQTYAHEVAHVRQTQTGPYITRKSPEDQHLKIGRSVDIDFKSMESKKLVDKINSLPLGEREKYLKAGNALESDKELYAEIESYMVPYLQVGTEFSETPLGKALGVKKGSKAARLVYENTFRDIPTIYENQDLGWSFGDNLKRLLRTLKK